MIEPTILPKPYNTLGWRCRHGFHDEHILATKVLLGFDLVGICRRCGRIRKGHGNIIAGEKCEIWDKPLGFIENPKNVINQMLE